MPDVKINAAMLPRMIEFIIGGLPGRFGAFMAFS